MNLKSKERITWIDYCRGFCMLCVILYHTFSYAIGNGRIILPWIEPFFLTMFFFLSGYLTNTNSFNFKNSIKSLTKKLIFPYFVFSIIIFYPKFLSHGYEVTLVTAIKNIFGGYASWFITTLICAKLFMGFILSCTKKLKYIWIITLLLFFAGIYVTAYVNINFPWNINKGLITIFWITSGMTYRKYENFIKHLSLRYLIIAILLYMIMICFNKYVHTYMHCSYYPIFRNIDIIQYTLFNIISIFSIWIIIELVKRLPNNVDKLSYIGKNSLIFYFLNGGVVTVINWVFKIVGVLPPVFHLFIVFITTIVILYIASYLINRFAPWMIGNFKRQAL